MRHATKLFAALSAYRERAWNGAAMIAPPMISAATTMVLSVIRCSEENAAGPHAFGSVQGPLWRPGSRCLAQALRGRHEREAWLQCFSRTLSLFLNGHSQDGGTTRQDGR